MRHLEVPSKLRRGMPMNLNQLILQLALVTQSIHVCLSCGDTCAMTFVRARANQPPRTSILPSCQWASAAVTATRVPASSVGVVKALLRLARAGSTTTSVGEPAHDTHQSWNACHMLAAVSRPGKGTITWKEPAESAIFKAGIR